MPPEVSFFPVPWQNTICNGNKLDLNSYTMTRSFCSFSVSHFFFFCYYIFFVPIACTVKNKMHWFFSLSFVTENLIHDKNTKDYKNTWSWWTPHLNLNMVDYMCALSQNIYLKENWISSNVLPLVSGTHNAIKAIVKAATTV